jgi:hypothetical protein
MSEFPPAVGSTVWNLAGGVTTRPDYLKSLVLGGIKLQAPSIGQVLNKGYLNGPMVKLRGFLQWAHKDPDFLDQFGITSGTLLNKTRMNYQVVAEECLDQVRDGRGIQIFLARIDNADIAYWVLRYLADTRDGAIPTHTYEFNPSTQVITIKFGEDDPVEIISVTDFDNTSRYLYVGYYEIDKNVPVGTPDVQSPVTLTEGQNFPVLDGWTEDGLSDVVKTADLNVYETVDITYSDDRTPVHTGPTVISTINTSVTERYGSYHQDGPLAPLPDNPNSSAYLRTGQTQQLTYAVGTHTTTTVNTQTLPSGVVETRTTTRVEERFVATRVYQITTQTIIAWAWLPQRYYIYPQGGGKPNLDLLFINNVVSSVDKYYPPIPFRYDNSAIVTKSSVWRVVVNVECAWSDPNFELWIARDAKSTASALRAKHVAPGIGMAWDYYVQAWEKGENLRTVLGGTKPVFQWRTRLEPDDEDDNREEHFWKSPWNEFTFPPESTPPNFMKPPYFYGENAADLSYLHTACKKAFKKAVGAKFDNVQDDILANESIKDIDHAFVVFGVALNVEDNRNRRYIYKFFKHVMEATSTPFEEEEWLGEFDRVDENNQAYNPDGIMECYPDPPYKTLEIRSDHPGVINFKTELKWSFIKEQIGTGFLERRSEISEATVWTIKLDRPWWWNTTGDRLYIAPDINNTDLSVEVISDDGVGGYENEENGICTYKVRAARESDWATLVSIMKQDAVPIFLLPDDSNEWVALSEKPVEDITSFKWVTGSLVKAKVGDLWWNWEVPADNYFDAGDRVELYWQVSETTWQKLVFTELEFRNYVYKDSVIKRRANVELAKPRKETDFIVPLHDDILRSLSFVDQTQVATACAFLVFNCYEIKKKEWYQEEWFNYVLSAVVIVISIAITVATYGYGGTAAGVGAAAAIGAIFGLSGMAAIIVGATVLAIMQFIMSKLLGMLFSAMFKDMGTSGQVLSAAISAVISIAASWGTSSASVWTVLSDSSTLMGLASVATAAARAVIDENIKKINEDLQAMWKLYGEKSEQLAKLFEELTNASKFDTSIAAQFVNELTEKPEVFLKRTLMTGSDIVESTQRMISDYTELNLKLELP